MKPYWMFIWMAQDYTIIGVKRFERPIQQEIDLVREFSGVGVSAYLVKITPKENTNAQG